MTNNIKPTEAWAYIEEDGTIGMDGISFSVYPDRLEGEQRVYIVPAEEWERLRGHDDE